jgi:hypothetical protein
MNLQKTNWRMRGLIVVLFISFFADAIYTLGILLLPGPMAKFGMAPQEILWARFLAPIYAALCFANWHAFRNPVKNEAIVQMLVVLWGFLVLIHVFTLGTGIEEWNSGLRLSEFDFVMTAGLAYFYFYAKRAP